MGRITPYFAAFGLFALTTILASCAGNGPRPSMEIGWPPPPQEPRILYLGSFSGSQDLERSFWGSLKDFFFGKADGMDIGKPYGVRQTEQSRLYIADTGRKGILVVDRDAGVMEFFNSLGPYGSLGEPVYVLAPGNGEIYVSDTKLGRVVAFNPDHEFKRYIGREGDLESPVGMSLDSINNELYVVDSKQHQILVFDLAGGKLQRRIGRRGDNKGEFHAPTTIALSPDAETIYVVDAFHFAVQALDRNGDYLFSFGPSKVGMGTMARPRDIALDSEGHIYVTDALRNNVQIYDNAGNLLLRFGGMGLGPGQFRLPAGISIDKSDVIYIADSVNGRIQMFKYLGSPQEPQR